MTPLIAGLGLTGSIIGPPRWDRASDSFLAPPVCGSPFKFPTYNISTKAERRARDSAGYIDREPPMNTPSQPTPPNDEAPPSSTSWTVRVACLTALLAWNTGMMDHILLRKGAFT